MSWNGVKQQSIKSEIEAWCEEMEIQNYTINLQGEIDVNGNVDLMRRDFKKLPYKFGVVQGNFEVKMNNDLISLNNCPNIVGGYFTCRDCSQLDSLEGCPKEVRKSFWCSGCKREFTKEEVRSLCEVKGGISVNITGVIDNTFHISGSCLSTGSGG